MYAMTEIEVLTRGRHRAAADVLVASHTDYPAFRHIFPDRSRRVGALRPFFEATVRDAIPFGAVFAAGDAALAVWSPPGTFPWTAARKARATPTLLRTLMAAPRSFAAFTALGANAARAHPTEPNWYLVALGVRPSEHGRGHGSRLVAAGLARADRDGIACYLETSDPANVRFYERFGFTVVEPELRLVAGGPPHVAMRRPPGG